MAGDWIKMRCNLWDDPRVTAICDATDSGEAAVVGSLYWLWATADQHSEDGQMPGLTLRQIDRKTGLQGFGAALVQVGWLAEVDGGVQILGFEEHNGASAKKRCQTAQRVASARSRNAQETQHEEESNAASVTGALAREEKRREEEIHLLPTVEGSGAALRAAPPKPAPDFDGRNFEILNGKSIVPIAAGWELPESWGVDAEALGWKPVEVLREAEKFRQYWTAGRGSGTRRSVKGWRQSWSTWLEKAARDQR
jgi:hypothetical protein